MTKTGKKSQRKKGNMVPKKSASGPPITKDPTINLVSQLTPETNNDGMMIIPCGLMKPKPKHMVRQLHCGSAG